jgi:ribose/xylose/arabinose/galactoside ABC-type transport system permease subunit
VTEAETIENEEASRAKKIAKGVLRHENFVLGVILAGVLGVFGVLSGGYAVSPSNIVNILIASSTRGVAAIGQAFVILTAGIDLSVGGMALFALALGAMLMVGGAGLSIGPTIVVMMVLGIAIGLANGLLVSRINMPPLIVTLAVWGILRGAAYQVTGGRVISPLPEGVDFIGQGRIAGVPTVIIVFVAVAIVGYFVLNYTSLGRSVYAVGGSPTSAWLSGLNVPRVLLWVYAISGLCGAIAGLIIMSRTLVASMQSVPALELDAISAVVIGGVSLMGGRGSIIGVVLGVLILGVIHNGMGGLAVDPAFQDMIKGAIIYAAVAIDYTRRR